MTTGTLDRLDTGTGSELRVTDIAARIRALDLGLESGWIPDDPYANTRCHCGQVHAGALITPTGVELASTPIAAELVRGVDHKPGWPIWLDEVHHADAEWAGMLDGLDEWVRECHLDVTVWDEELRALCSPVEISSAWRDSDTRLLVSLIPDPSFPPIGGQVYDDRDGWITAPATSRAVGSVSRTLAEAALGIRHELNEVASSAATSNVEAPKLERRPWWRRLLERWG